MDCWRLALEDFAGLDAARANANALANAVDLGFDRLQVRVPAAARYVVRVRNVVAELRAFAADITYLCHDKLSVNKTCVRLPYAMPRETNRLRLQEPSKSADLFLVEDVIWERRDGQYRRNRSNLPHRADSILP